MFAKAKASAASASAETSPLILPSPPFLIYHVVALSGSTGYSDKLQFLEDPFLNKDEHNSINLQMLTGTQLEGVRYQKKLTHHVITIITPIKPAMERIRNPF